MTSRTYDEILEECTSNMGREFGEVFCLTKNEWVEISSVWSQYKNMFSKGPERVDLMNRSGANFFYWVGRLFPEAVLLAICRLCDPVSSAGNANLTVNRFQNFMDTAERRTAMSELLKEVQSRTSFARDWRNRRISHNDYKLKLGKAEPLEVATLESVDEAISALHSVFAYIYLEYMETNYSSDVIEPLNNEMQMLHRLHLGDERLKADSGSPRTEDSWYLNIPDWLQN